MKEFFPSGVSFDQLKNPKNRLFYLIDDFYRLVQSEGTGTVYPILFLRIPSVFGFCCPHHNILAGFAIKMRTSKNTIRFMWIYIIQSTLMILVLHLVLCTKLPGTKAGAMEVLSLCWWGFDAAGKWGTKLLLLLWSRLIIYQWLGNEVKVGLIKEAFKLFSPQKSRFNFMYCVNIGYFYISKDVKVLRSSHT